MTTSTPRFLVFCRYVGYGVISGFLYSCHSIWHQSQQSSDEIVKQVETLMRKEYQIDALEKRAQLIIKALPEHSVLPAAPSSVPKSAAPNR
jgi:hypothetical protein